MRHALIALVGSLLLVTGSEARVIYGEDNRMEVFEGTPFQQKLADASATMIHQKELTRDRSLPGVVNINQKTLKEWLDTQGEGGDDKAKRVLSTEALRELQGGVSFCPSVKFTDQPNPGTCSGFLIAKDLLLTAGHCSKVENFCEEQSWVFGFSVDGDSKKAPVSVSESDVYRCKKVISSTLTMSLSLDYALVQLDRPVMNRTPLEIRNDKAIDNSSTLMVIGSPSGLPLKIATGGKVRSNTHPFFFTANLDTFSGNSGSPVINAVTGVAEGILVRGEEDYKLNRAGLCIESRLCDDNGCRGEDVTRLTAIPEIGVQVALNKAAQSGDMAVLTGVLKLDTWVDFYGKDGVTALMRAASGGSEKAVSALIAKGAEVNRQDGLGNSSLHYLADVLSEKNSGALSALLRAGANLESRNVSGDTALLVAGKKLNLEGVKILIQNGADKNARDINGETVIASFVRSGKSEQVKTLIELGVDAGTTANTASKTCQSKASL